MSTVRCAGCFTFVPDPKRRWSSIGTCTALPDGRVVHMTMQRYCCLRTEPVGATKRNSTRRPN